MYLLFLIVNKSGTLIYDMIFSDKMKIDANDNITLGGVFYAQYNMAAKLTPSSLIKKSELDMISKGLEVIESDFSKIICFESLTKMKFLFVTDKSTNESECEDMYKKIYDLYTDLVSKNPFYELEMPIRNKNFDREIQNLFS